MSVPDGEGVSLTEGRMICVALGYTDRNAMRISVWSESVILTCGDGSDGVGKAGLISLVVTMAHRIPEEERVMWTRFTPPAPGLITGVDPMVVMRGRWS